jgi:hypothetical protein
LQELAAPDKISRSLEVRREPGSSTKLEFAMVATALGKARPLDLSESGKQRIWASIEGFHRFCGYPDRALVQRTQDRIQVVLK